MTAYNTPAGATSGGLEPTNATPAPAGTTGLTPVYPYSPPNDGQTWPRPY